MPIVFTYQRKLTLLALIQAIILLMVTNVYALEKATIQLKWLHHYQFAGYYMALEKGFYREEGLDVTIREGGPTAEVEKDVAAGRADFGTGTSALLVDRARGADFVVVGQVFQHSPAIFMTPRKSGIRSVRDMAGKRFMYANQHGDMQALLKKHLIDEKQIIKVPHRGDPRDLIEGKADVMLAYSFNEPYIMELAGEPYFTFSPMSFGIDFYGDNFFTTGKNVTERPGFVSAFRKATLRGWQYALQNREETAEVILAKYPRGLSREHLLFEADQMDTLIQPLMIELGYQSPTRWQRISETYAELGMIPKGFDPTPIIYTPTNGQNHRPLILALLFSSIIIGFLAWLLFTFRRLNVRLNRHIEERHQVEENLKKSEQELRELAEAMPQIVWITNPDGRFIYFNHQWMDYTGMALEESIGYGWDKPCHPDDRQKAWQAWEQASASLDTYSLECRLRRADGVYKWWLVRGVPVFDQQGVVKKWFGTCTDIDDLKNGAEEKLFLERQLLHAQKLESIGVLAGGIAHDFNNILTAIIGNVEINRMKLEPESPLLQGLINIENAANRAAELARQMLAYSGKGKFLIENIDLHALLQEMLQMMEVSISKKVELRLNLTPDTPHVEADATQIRQVIMNLVINASEAIGDTPGVISITTGTVYCNEKLLQEVWHSGDLREGEYVYFEICDTGCGMDSETLAKLYDPFFSTKFTGRGLGMAAVQGIVRSHNGAIYARSEPGNGTCFKVLLPAKGSPTKRNSTLVVNDRWQGHGNILLVDDEEAIREIGSELLTGLGFTVLTASEGLEAIEIYTAGNDIDLVILDLTMPKMNGIDCYCELKKINPDVKVIISSGYSEEDVIQQFSGQEIAGFIQKPYKLSLLKEVLQKVVQ
ncbi:MAG: ABC transporter substrate-binding protein [Geobacteraceae bacterium]|nr:ABC transporter substrate-binding protein [Geobacteraceae bacterium]